MKYDILVVGAGIVGLATAMRIKELSPGMRVAVLEKENQVAGHQTGNNSGVIHAGIYYRPGSLKAVNCRSGYDQLLRFCDQHGISYELCGKLIIASGNEELRPLDTLHERAQKNGLTKVIRIAGEGISDYEPHATGIAGLWVPYTGIVDFAEVAAKYAQVFMEKHQGEIFTNTLVRNIIDHQDGAEVITEGDSFTAHLVINTAGLHADRVAKFVKPRLDVRIIPFRGEYSVLKKDRTFLIKNLIYPVPDPRFPFLGVHFTRRISGVIDAGPNAVWAFKREGYGKSDFDLDEILGALRWKGFRKVMRQYWKTGMGEFYRSFSKAAMVHALQKLVPEIRQQDLEPGGAGVRAIACDRQGGLIDDFLFVEDRHFIHVLNAPSPAATASLAIGMTIAEKALKRF